MTSWNEIAKVEAIDRRDFYGDFVAKRKPVVIRNLTSSWRALEWNLEYFRSYVGGVKLAVKLGDISQGIRENMLLKDYIELLERYEARLEAGEDVEKPGYLHDVPFFHAFPALKSDAEPFPLQLFPKWYWSNWQRYVQFFMGPTGSITPLHFDTLGTNNLFFQVVGKKRFILIPAEQKEYCYMRNWRWARFDPSAPDFDAFPLAAATTPVSVVIKPGEILYIPPGTLHHVEALSLSISFNIDWHTAETARQGLIMSFNGAPWQNMYYNLLSWLGLGFGISEKYIFPYYKSYLNYVS